MRVSAKKDLSKIRQQILDHIDSSYSQRIEEIMGPLYMIHQLKRQRYLVVDDEDASKIAQRVEEQDKDLLRLDIERRNMKDEVRAINDFYKLQEYLDQLLGGNNA